MISRIFSGKFQQDDLISFFQSLHALHILVESRGGTQNKWQSWYHMDLAQFSIHFFSFKIFRAQFCGEIFLFRLKYMLKSPWKFWNEFLNCLLSSILAKIEWILSLSLLSVSLKLNKQATQFDRKCDAFFMQIAGSRY